METINKTKLLEEIKKCYNQFNNHLETIKNTETDTDNDKLNLLITNMLNIFPSDTNIKGGMYTYNCTRKINIKTNNPDQEKDLSNYIKTIAHQGDTFIESKKTNIIIAGAGPNGLYASILLKTIFNNFDIIIIDNRGKDNKHFLTRDQKMFIKGISSIKDNESILTLIKYIKLYAPDILPFFLTKPYIDDLDKPFVINEKADDIFALGAIYTSGGVNKIHTNILECKLLHIAQSIRVKLYIDSSINKNNNKANSKNSIFTLYEKYINNQTLLFFDATGGRIINPNKPIKSIGKQLNNNFNSYNGSLNTNNSINHLTHNNDNDINLIYIAIGDTTVRINWHTGSGFMYNWTLILFYVLTLGKFFYNKPYLQLNTPINETIVGGSIQKYRTKTNISKKKFLQKSIILSLTHKKSLKKKKNKTIYKQTQKH
jgi:hypothetical protein